MRFFNGTTDRIDYTGLTPPVSSGGIALTIAMWCRWLTTIPIATSDLAVVQLSTTNANGYGIWLGLAAGQDGRVQFGRRRATSARSVNGSRNVYVNRYHHIAVVDSGALAVNATRIYVDGHPSILTADTAGSGAGDAIDGNFAIGGEVVSNTFNGNIDIHSVTWWSGRQLSSQQIARLARGVNPWVSGEFRQRIAFHADYSGTSYLNKLGGAATLVGTSPRVDGLLWRKPWDHRDEMLDDAAATGVLYPQLERYPVRGLLRGVAR